MIDIDLKIDCLKNKLLDLGKRNKLINYCQTKKTSIAIKSPDLSVIYNKLVINREKLTFKDDYLSKDSSNIAEYGITLCDNGVESSGLKNFFGNSSKLYQTLVSIRDRGVSAVKDRGADILYIAFGFLNWTDAKNKAKKLTSPLVLVPVKVYSDNICKEEDFFVNMADLPVIVNPTLALMLELDYGFVLPKLNNQNQDIIEYLKLISKRLYGHKWALSISNDCVLGVFSFLKMNLYNDIEKNRDGIKASSLIQMLMYGDGIRKRKNFEDLDQVDFKGINACNVLMADGYQNDVIKQVVSGESIVITGGVGVGKSTVLANITVNMLALNKKVLFVTDNNSSTNSVWNELMSVGLSEHILMMQNHKMQLDDVLNDLEQTLRYINNTDLTSNTKHVVDSLEGVCKYGSDLDAIRTSLGVSLREILAVVNRLKEEKKAKQIPIDLLDILDTTHEKLSSYVKFISEVFKYITINKSKIVGNVWSNCRVNQHRDNDSKEFVPTVVKICSELYDNLGSLNSCLKEVNNKANVFDVLNASGAKAIIEIKEKCSISKAFPSEWIEYIDFEQVRKEVEEFAHLQEQIMWANQNIIISSNFRQDEIDASELINNLNLKCDVVRKLLNSKKYIGDEEIASMCDTLIERLKKANDILVAAYRDSEYTSTKYGVPKSFTISDCIAEMKFINEVTKNPRPTTRWFESAQKVALNKLLDSSKEMFATLKDTIKYVDRYVNDTIFQIDFEVILKRFTQEYVNNKMIFFSKAYRIDRQVLKTCFKDNNAKIDDVTIIEILTKVKEIVSTREWIKRNEGTLSEFFGKHYVGEDTNWDNIKSQIKVFNNIQGRFSSTLMPSKLKDVLIKGISTDKSKNNMLEYQLEEAVEILSEELVDVDYMNKDMVKLSKSVMYVLRILKGVAQSYDQMKQFHKEGTPFNDMILNLRSIDFAKQCYSKFYEKELRIKEICGGMYNGVNTNFEDILLRLDFANTFTKLNLKYGFSDKFVRKICNKENFISAIFEDKILFEDIVKGQNQYQNIMNDYCNMFDDAQEMCCLTFDKQIKTLHSRLTDLESLQIWTTYQRILDNANSIGITLLLEQVLSGEFSTVNECVDTFLLSFYMKLVEQVVEVNGDIGKGISSNAQNKISLFNQNKRQYQQEILDNVDTVRKDIIMHSRCLCNKTKINEQKHSLDTEIRKAKRTISTKMLLDSIPELVLAVKPCVMVSPMAVGVMLQNPGYKFDLVIFDQAASILFEEAVPAIVRAKQLVIAGDINQLPPKEYFALADMQEVYGVKDFVVENINLHNSDLFKEITSTTSILEKGLSSNVKTTELKTHYQSNCEDIIYFPNKYTYDNRLVTAPSPMSGIYSEDFGVDYIYVSDGIYDRGGSNSNYNEAVKVVTIILECNKKYPNKSIGVIALSEAQQSKILEIINRYKQYDNSFDNLFSSETNKLFIKTLENIECDDDKRDILIISVGFAKDSKGKLELNFGSLCKNGGEKRLNVALTRAKDNLKFVTSVLPHEIDISESTPNGIVNLHDYMVYASSINRDLWVKHLPSNQVGEMDIRKNIGKFIEQKSYSGVGYGVKYYLGNSDIKIDIVVYDKRNPNKYIMGIVLDDSLSRKKQINNVGNNDFSTNLSYMDLLKRNGWNIFSTWSYNWVMDNESEKARLLRAITSYTKLLKDLPLNFTVDLHKILKDSEKSEKVTEYEVKLTEKDLEQEHIYKAVGFSYYNPIDLSKVVKEDESVKTNIENCVKTIVENEYPIQFNYMCKQVCFAIKEPKVTAKLKEYIQEVITKNLSQVVYLNNNFCYLKTQEILPVRVFKKGGVLRPIQNISTVEIAKAMERYCLYINYEISVNELLDSIMKFYGFAKMGETIKVAMQEAFELFALSDSIIFDKQTDSIKISH